MSRMTGLVAQGLLIATTLSACNTTDALIPKVDVGESSINSPPVTQSDLAAVERQPEVVHAASRRAAAPMDPIAESPLAPVSTGSVQPLPPADVAYAAPSTGYHDPAGSLDAQAARLQHTPDRLETQEDAPRRGPVRETAALAEPAEQDAPPPRRQAEAATAEPAPANESAALAPAESGDATTVRFLPIIGAPVGAVEPLSRALGADARSNGLKIKTSADPSARHMLKGYLSALSDGGKTTVTYVWDVLDASGNRLTRLQGQESVRGIARDPWSAVPAETMQAIGSKTIAAYLSWRSGSRS